MHAELLEPAIEHDGHERELPFHTPLAGQANPRVLAAAVGRHLPAAAVPGAESHVAIRTDDLDDDVEDAEVDWVTSNLPPLGDTDDDDEDG